MDQPRALRELQAALHLRIDALYAALPPRIRAIIRRHMRGGVLTPVAAALAAAEIAQLLERVDDATAPLIAQGTAAAVILVDQGEEPDIAAAWRAAAGFAAARYLFAARRSLRDSRANSVDQVRRVLIGAAQSGRPQAVITLHLEQYVNPWYATRRNPTGAQTRLTRTGARVSGPAVPGNASSPARRLMLRQTSDAHGEWGIVTAQRTPGALIRWRLNPAHTKPDECDTKARQNNGWGPGIYLPSTVPRYPSHRGCLCILTVVQPIEEAAA